MSLLMRLSSAEVAGGIVANTITTLVSTAMAAIAADSCLQWRSIFSTTPPSIALAYNKFPSDDCYEQQWSQDAKTKSDSREGREAYAGTNVVHLKGHVGCEPRYSITGAGAEWASIHVFTAINVPRHDGTYQTVKREAHNVTVFGNALLNYVRAYVHKGVLVEVVGRLTYATDSDHADAPRRALVSAKQLTVQKHRQR